MEYQTDLKNGNQVENKNIRYGSDNLYLVTKECIGFERTNNGVTGGVYWNILNYERNISFMCNVSIHGYEEIDCKLINILYGVGCE